MDAEPQQGTGCFTLAVTRYKRELHRYLLRRLRRPQDVEDLAQEVYMRLARLSEAKDVRNALSYLYGVASNVVADFTAEAAQERQHLSVSSEAVERWVDQPTEVLPDNLADRLDLQQLIERMLAELPAMQAAVLVLHDRDGMSYEEIARETGLSVHTVHKYLVQARSRIRTMNWER